MVTELVSVSYSTCRRDVEVHPVQAEGSTGRPTPAQCPQALLALAPVTKGNLNNQLARF